MSAPEGGWPFPGPPDPVGVAPLAAWQAASRGIAKRPIISKRILFFIIPHLSVFKKNSPQSIKRKRLEISSW
jgi:hypothetical protein